MGFSTFWRILVGESGFSGVTETPLHLYGSGSTPGVLTFSWLFINMALTSMPSLNVGMHLLTVPQVDTL